MFIEATKLFIFIDNVILFITAVMIHHYILFLLVFISNIICRDFYAGMFKKDDLLVAQDRLYKDRVPYQYMYAKYGRYFKCPITYFRVVDRLGVGRGPTVEVIRGGIRYKYMVLRLRTYNLPISVNIYIGCENKIPRTKKTTPILTNANVTEKAVAGNGTGELKTTGHANGTGVTEAVGGNSTSNGTDSHAPVA